MVRKNNRKNDIFLDLIDQLRSYSMTRQAIREFLSDRYRAAGSFDRRYKIDDIEDAQISEKTVTRTLAAVRDKYGDRLTFENDAYHLELDDFPDTICPDELQALDVAIQKTAKDVLTNALLTQLNTKLTSRLFRKIKQRDPKHSTKNIADIQQQIDSYFAFVGPHAKIDIKPDIKTDLDYAITHQNKIVMIYKGKEYSVCPLGIMYGPNNIYLIASLCKNGQVTHKPCNYILSEITSIRNTGEFIRRDNNFSIETYANSMFGVYHDRTIYDVEWHVSPSAAKEAMRYQFHPTQQIIKNADNSLTIRFQSGGLYAISLYLTQWGGEIIPVAPAELITMYKTLLTKCLESVTDK